ncbi:MFS transporter [Methanolobus sp. ZRKC3]|uniref:MFS transporter n=1 Tax=Methanolobus sp. ZRKC3 TaxID=3125786 RepID=UPI0032494892
MDKNRFLIYSTVFLIMGLSDSVIPVLPELAAANHVTHGALASSLLFSGYFIGALVTMLPFGVLVDRYDYLKFIVLAILLTFVSGIFLIITDNLYLLIIARFVEGSACGAFFPAAYAMLSEYVEKNRYISEFNFLLNAGLALGVAIAGYLAEWSVRGGIILFTALAGIISLSGIFTVVFQKKTKPARKIINVKDVPQFHQLSSVFLDRRYASIWITAFLIFGITGVLIAFYPDYSKDFLSKTGLGIAISLLYVSSMITNLVVGRMDMQYKQMIRYGIVIASVGTLLSIKFPITGFVLIGIGSGIGLLGLPIAVTHMNIKRGLAMGFFNTCTYAGLGLMPIFFGLFLDRLGFQLIFSISALVLFLSVFLKSGLEKESGL